MEQKKEIVIKGKRRCLVLKVPIIQLERCKLLEVKLPAQAKKVTGILVTARYEL
ncbi:MAG TPA: hypothetical protein VNB90_15090 [Cytophagaceae bacterium]|jgi:hypothetical protein|nr:hypothetical protein [Cytophagaceae bacterium]